MTDVTAYSSELELEWNCHKTILVARPRRHLEKAKFVGRAVFATRVFLMGATTAQAASSNVLNLKHFDGDVATSDLNCHAADFKPGQAYCPENETGDDDGKSSGGNELPKPTSAATTTQKPTTTTTTTTTTTKATTAATTTSTTTTIATPVPTTKKTTTTTTTTTTT